MPVTDFVPGPITKTRVAKGNIKYIQMMKSGLSININYTVLIHQIKFLRYQVTHENNSFACRLNYNTVEF